MSREQDTISVIIPAYNECPGLVGCVDLILAQTVEPLEIIIVHSGSHDPSRALAGRDPRVRVIHGEARLLAGSARNVASDHAQGEWLAFIDADVRPAGEWLENLLAAVRRDPNRLIGGSVGHAETGGYWGLPLWTIEFSSVPLFLPDRQTQGVASANMMVSAAAFSRVGGFPSRFPTAEDTILGAKLRAVGVPPWFCAAARVNHMNIGGFRHFARHLFRLGRLSAICRRAAPLSGRVAVRFWPLAFGLFASKFAATSYRALRWGSGQRARFCALAPGILVGLLIWNAGFLSGLRGPIPPLDREPSLETLGAGPAVPEAEAASPPHISVIICTYNRSRLLKRALMAFATQEGAADSEIIVVDNNSTDDTDAAVRQCVAARRGLTAT